MLASVDNFIQRLLVPIQSPISPNRVPWDLLRIRTGINLITPLLPWKWLCIPFFQQSILTKEKKEVIPLSSSCFRMQLYLNQQLWFLWWLVFHFPQQTNSSSQFSQSPLVSKQAKIEGSAFHQTQKALLHNISCQRTNQWIQNYSPADKKSCTYFKINWSQFSQMWGGKWTKNKTFQV